MIPKNNPTVEVGRNVDLKNVSLGSLPKRSPPYKGGRKPLVRRLDRQGVKMSGIRNQALLLHYYAIALPSLSTPLYLRLVLCRIVVAGGHD